MYLAVLAGTSWVNIAQAHQRYLFCTFSQPSLFLSLERKKLILSSTSILKGYGYNRLGHYSTSLITALHNGYKARPDDLSTNVKGVAVFAEYIKQNYGNFFYAKAQNLVRVLVEAYNKALKTYDVLIMPTIPFTATKIPPQDIKAKGKYVGETSCSASSQ